jgi:hypothetical protein
MQLLRPNKMPSIKWPQQYQQLPVCSYAVTNVQKEKKNGRMADGEWE